MKYSVNFLYLKSLLKLKYNIRAIRLPKNINTIESSKLSIIFAIKNENIMNIGR